MSEGLVDVVRAAVAAGNEADEVLRATVRALAAQAGVAWAGIAFAESGSLLLGPQAGTPDADRRVRAPVRYRGELVAELWVDGEVDPAALGEVAELVGEHCLVGWDTGGAPWGA